MNLLNIGLEALSCNIVHGENNNNNEESSADSNKGAQMTKQNKKATNSKQINIWSQFSKSCFTN